MKKSSSSTKDIIIFSLLTLIVILIILSMYQRDREWIKLSSMERALSEQSRDVSTLRGSLNAVEKKLESLRIQSQSAVALTNMVKNTNNMPKSGGVSLAFKRAKIATEQEDYAQGDWSVSSLGSGLKTITPLVSSDRDASTIQSYVLESLITRDPDTLEWTGLIAHDWTISDDGLIITFNLRNDVYFSDGEPLDSSDVVFSFDFIMNEKIQAPRHRAYLEKIKSVTANSPHQVTFTFKEPYFEAFSLAGTLEVIPEHFYKEYLDTPQIFNDSKGLLMGTGPYQLADPKGWTPDNGNVELIRNSRYWGDVQPPQDRILWRVIQNASARLTTYRNGDIDAYGARPIEYEKLKKDKQITDKSHQFEYMPPVVGYSYIGWNQKRKGKATLFADKRVRQAMTYLIDRDRVNKDIFLGYGETAISPFSPRSKQHNPTLSPRAYDLEKGKALLKEVGFEDRDNNGVLENEAGEPFEFELTYFQGNEDTQRMILLIKDLYAKAGVKLIPTPQEWPVMIELLDKKDFEAITLGWTSGIETDIFQMFHGSQAKTNGDNFINYKNSDLDKLIDEARKTVDADKRMPLWQQAEALMYEDQPYTFLFRRKSLAFLDKRLKNLKLTKLGLNKSFLPLEVYVPKNMQKYTQ
ncbi:MAG: peptide/nickel transport system substrate-binding protein [Cocleimonas sp.]|jgi:peptide/nickel transport system substrate-binding protein